MSNSSSPESYKGIKREMLDDDNNSIKKLIKFKKIQLQKSEHYEINKFPVDMDNVSDQDAENDIDVKYEQDVDLDNIDEFKKPNHSEVIHDIFGDSDEEEFEGFNENEVEEKVEEIEKEVEYPVERLVHRRIEKLNEDAEEEFPDESQSIMHVFNSIVEKQKLEKKLYRPKKRDNVEYLNDMDDKVADLMAKMRLASVEDEELYFLGQPGIKKMQLLPEVRSLLKRSNIKEVLIESKFLSIMATWLKPLPKHILPPLDIRVLILKSLIEFPSISSEILKESSLGKAVMYLFKHPKETADNKKMAKHLIDEWSRPVFNLSSNYDHMTKEERLERDRNIGSKRRLVDQDAYVQRDMDDEDRKDSYGSRLSTKDYINRPKWRVGNAKRAIDYDNIDENNDENDNDNNDDEDFHENDAKRVRIQQSSNKKELGLERTFRKIKDAGKKRKMIQRATNVSIQGKGLDI